MAQPFLEIEVKILEVDVTAVTEKLASLGAAKSFDGTVRDWFLDYPDKRLKKADKLLRLRFSGEEPGELVMKGPCLKSDGYKKREEWTVRFAEGTTPESVLELYKGMELTAYSQLEKHRTAYAFDDVTLIVDAYKEIPPYVEIEGPSEASIEAAIKKLGLENHTRSTLSCGELLEQYRNA